MRIIKITDNDYLVYTAKGVVVEQIEKDVLVNQIAQLSVSFGTFTNAELVQWAKDNHPIYLHEKARVKEFKIKQDLLTAVNLAV